MRDKRICCVPLMLALLSACSDKPEPPKVIDAIAVSIDASNNCSLESKPVECAQVAAIIKSRYPTSKPRVDVCLDKQTRYEAAVEVMNSVKDAGFPIGTLDCKAGG
jgi:biopolymer transport protein ExbD